MTKTRKSVKNNRNTLWKRKIEEIGFGIEIFNDYINHTFSKFRNIDFYQSEKTNIIKYGQIKKSFIRKSTLYLMRDKTIIRVPEFISPLQNGFLMRVSRCTPPKRLTVQNTSFVIETSSKQKPNIYARGKTEFFFEPDLKALHQTVIDKLNKACGDVFDLHSDTVTRIIW